MSMGSLEVVDDALSSDSSMSMGSGVYIVLGVVILIIWTVHGSGRSKLDSAKMGE